MPLALTASHDALVKGSRAKYLTTCWRMVRNDTRVFRYTEHDKQLVVSREPYSPSSGFDATARQRQSDLRDQNLEALGAVSTSGVSAEDLRNGMFDGAHVSELRVDWRYPWLGPFMMADYWIDAVRWTGLTWAVDLVGITRWLRRRSGITIDVTCRHTLGDGGCRVNLANFADGGIVTALEPGDDGFGNQDRRKFRTDMTGRADDYFNFGLVRWISGNNARFAPLEVKDYASTNGAFEMHMQLPYDVAVNDEFVAYAGCDRLKTTCDVKFLNLDNFGGYEYIPGNDKINEAAPNFFG